MNVVKSKQIKSMENRDKYWPVIPSKNFELVQDHKLTVNPK